MLTPVVLFTYKRLSTTKSVIDSLRDNEEAKRTELIVYSDGPKNISDVDKVEDVRCYLKSLTGFKSIELIYRDKNFGLAQSFISGISETLNRYERAIFLEDDNLLSKHFLSFMNEALDYYKDNEKVICVTGYSWPLRPAPKQPYFLRGAETWSMGTWRRAWRYFCPDGKRLLLDLQSRGLVKKFRSDGFGFYEMLKSQVRGDIDSWGVRWWASAYINDMYCLYPHKPLCVSIGYGEDSVHCSSYGPMFRRPSDLTMDPIVKLPSDVEETIKITLCIRFMNKILPIRGPVSRFYGRTISYFSKSTNNFKSRL
jgi:hypothetical protein